MEYPSAGSSSPSSSSSPQDSTPFWRKCSSCKKPIAFGSKYYVCSVSTCTGPRTNYVFCSVSCFERHLPGARHKDAGAVEMTAPRSAPPAATPTPQGPSASHAPGSPNRVFATKSPAGSAVESPTKSSTQIPRETLVIASRLKEYIQARSDYNTSQSVMDVLSDHLRVIADRAIDNARAEGRKTVMDRDFAFLKS